MGSGDHTGSYYAYTPSTVAAAIFAIIYIIFTITSLVQTIRMRSWIWFVMIFASLMETIGYVSRVASTKNVDAKGPFVISFVLIILAPVVVAASIYILFGRIVFYITPQEKRTTRFLWVPPRFLTPIFMTFDLLSFVMQGIGAVQVSTGTTSSELNSGKTIVLSGLGVQIVAFGLFSIIGIRFNIKCRHFQQTPETTNRVAGNRKTPLNPNWMKLLIFVNISCCLILVRSIYRVAEFVNGPTGYISTHEWTFYVFDACMILPIFSLYILAHPGKYVPYMGFRVPRDSGSHSRPMPLSNVA
jgi:hypothetical protein